MTPSPPDNSHPPLDVLLEYFDGHLSDETEDAIEHHLWLCDACATLGQRLFAIDQTLDDWTAAAHGQLHLRVTLLRALVQAEAQTTNALWRQRLRHWRDTWSGTAETALRTVLSAAAQAARVTADNLDALTRPGSAWRLAPEPSFAGALGDEDADDASAVFTTSTLTPDAPRALVELKGGTTGDVVVRVDNLPIGNSPPLIVLIALKPDREVVVQVTEVTRQPGTNSYLARFSKLPPNEYIVAFEPLEM